MCLGQVKTKTPGCANSSGARSREKREVPFEGFSQKMPWRTCYPKWISLLSHRNGT